MVRANGAASDWTVWFFENFKGVFIGHGGHAVFNNNNQYSDMKKKPKNKWWIYGAGNPIPCPSFVQSRKSAIRHLELHYPKQYQEYLTNLPQREQHFEQIAKHTGVKRLRH